MSFGGGWVLAGMAMGGNGDGQRKSLITVGRVLIAIAAIVFVAGACFLLARKTPIAATYLGTWIVLLVVAIYGPVLIGALADPSTGAKVEGLNYFADTLLFGGVILSLARATTTRQSEGT